MTRPVWTKALSALLIWGASCATGLANAPQVSPRPMPRVANAMPAVAVARIPSQAVLTSPHPKAAPRHLRRTVAAVARNTDNRRKSIAGANKGVIGAVCGDRAILGKTIAPIAARLNGCGLNDGVRVISVSGVALTAPANLDCPTAKALKTWVEKGVKPAIRRKGGGVQALRVAASYSCRTRNNRKGAKISEHGRGRAIDISALLLANGTVVTVEKGWGSRKYGKALKKMRKAACGPFNTVLGPGSDRYHSDHFHLDTARGRGAYCR